MSSSFTSLTKILARKHKRCSSRALAIVLVTISAFSSAAHANWMGEARGKMGTEVSVYLWHGDAERGAEALEAVFAEMDRINALMSTYVDTSRISEVNREAARRWVVAGDELFQLVLRSLDISVLTRGAFDITYDSVGQHYDFRERTRPDSTTVEEELSRIDYRLVETNPHDNSIRFAREGVRINLGGIAKGYAVERGAEVLRDHGVLHARITAGGDTRLLGDRRGKPWVVGVRDPNDGDRVTIRIPLEDEAISTSGDYERFFIEDGTRYHHILKPSTGKPASGVRSATVVGPDGVITDALSTSLFVMGVDRGLRLIATLPDYEGIVIDAEGELFYSDGLRPPSAGE
jgi:thiamine biosynthesis lipoprotein